MPARRGGKSNSVGRPRKGSQANTGSGRKKSDTTESRWRRWIKKPGFWAVSAGIPLAIAVATVVVNGVAADMIDIPAVRDNGPRRIQDPDDIRWDVRYEDPGAQLILPRNLRLTAQQEAFLKNWSLADVGSDAKYTIRDLQRELRAAGAATPVSDMNLIISLEGRRHQDLNVEAVYPVEIRRFAPYDGTWLNIPSQDGGSTLQMMFDFDEHTPKARTIRGNGETSPIRPGLPWFTKNTLTLKDGKQDTLSIKTMGLMHAVTFKVRIDYRIGNDHRSLIVHDHGRPFAVSPINCLDRTPVDDKGRIITDKHDNWKAGNASYENIWTLGTPTMVKVPHPRRWSANIWCVDEPPHSPARQNR
ncbi:hypothetical protein ABZ897_58700 [Nonomuraea sp. NPDC046802]|uniref:hypothetical protein n=1 Tax=Nonomuraea sp. NPDC046802 TaxID=3154919 RepID=UPI0033F307EF